MKEKLLNRIGEENINTQGLRMWIKEYRGCNDVDIEFEDGYISYNKTYNNFKRGLIKNSDYEKQNSKRACLIDRTGEVKYNNHGIKMTIVEYINTQNIIVEFEGGYRVKTQYDNFKKGKVSNCTNRIAHKVSVLNENNSTSKEYYKWNSMMTRCYSKKYKEKYPTYKDCIVAEEWYNFENFVRWYKENYYEIEGEKMCLDKDILIKGNKIYSPDTCCFVPERINNLFINRKNYRGDFPIGVSLNKKDGKIRAKGTDKNNKSIYLGTFDTKIEAFQSYKEFKENRIKQVANDYKDQIPEHLYIAMINYKVEITD